MLEREEIIRICLNSPFPGTDKWPADHPIWDSWLPGKKSPRDAWKDKKLIARAVDNLLKMYEFSKERYPSFIKKVEQEIQEGKITKSVLDRFTIAKIAPKVTALSPKFFYDCLLENDIDISNGIYCPMAGFGGLIEGCRRWYELKKIDMTGKIEAYDINEKFCDWYGWTKRDLLSMFVKTNKTVIACPPFGHNYEHWLGTPDDMSDKTFEEWVIEIKKHIDSPKYLIFGPCKRDKRSGLFGKRVGIELYNFS